MVHRLSQIYEPPSIGKLSAVLSPAEVTHFKKEGFLFKKGLLDVSACKDLRARSWAYLCENLKLDKTCDYALDYENPETWWDPRWEKQAPPDKDGFYEGRSKRAVSGTTVKLHDFGSDPDLLAVTVQDNACRRVAELLLSENLRPSRRTRGVYAIFPSKKTHQAPLSNPDILRMLGPHCDRVVQQLNVCIYLDDVTPRNGGFTLYPGSHRIMHWAHQYAANWSPKSNFSDYVRRVVRQIQPIEFVGTAGDVVFWHGRSVHSAGIHTGDRIRWAVFGDYSMNRQTLNDDEHRACGQYEWFKDTELFRSDDPIEQGLFPNWRLGRA